LPEEEAKAKAAASAWRSINLRTVLGFMVRGKFVDLRDENNILRIYGQEVYDSLTPSMKRTLQVATESFETFMNDEELLEENNRLRKLAGL